MLNFIRNFIQSFSAASTTRSRSEQHDRCSRALRLEALEDRCLLATLFVNVDSPNPNGDGSSWNQACSSLQRALEIADLSSRNITDIWIAGGIYTPELRINNEPRTETFTLRNGVSLYGGFAGTEILLSQRGRNNDGSWVHETILSGDLVGNDFPTNLNTLRDNVYTVLSGTGLTKALTVEGITISGGYAVLTSALGSQGASSDWTAGGGMLLTNCSNITLNQVTFTHNTAETGGAMSITGGSVTLNEVQIHNNSSHDYGGGIVVSSGSLTIVGSSISDNYAVMFGGGIYQSGGSVSIVDSMVSGNTSWSGGGYYQKGGSATLKNSSLIGNIADDRGAVAGEGGGLYQNGTMTLVNVTFSLNVAGYGGAICAENPISSGTTIGNYSNVTISKNIATVAGGGIRVNSGSYTINNTIIADNSAPTGRDVSGDTKPITTFGGSYNLIGIGTGLPELWEGSTAKAIKNGVNGNLVGTSSIPIAPGLGAPTVLGNNGVYVLPLLTGSRAIRGGSISLVPSGIATDARGAQRISGSGSSRSVDIGAVEGSTSARNAVTYRVNSLENAIGIPGKLTLREALEAANSNKQVGNAPAGSFTQPDMIEFDSNVSGTFLLDGQIIQLFDGLIVKGTGMTTIVVDAQNLSGLLKLIGSFNVSLSGITLQNGCADHNGGGIAVYSSTLTMNNVAVRQSHSVLQGLGGGIYVKNGTLDCTNLIVAHCSGKSGGGIYQVNSTSTFINQSLYDNRSSEEAGAFYQNGGNAIIANATIARNESPFGGGLVFVGGTARLTHLTVTRNASENIGGVFVGSNAKVTMNNSIVADNFSYRTYDIHVYSNPVSGDGILSGTGNLVGVDTNLKGLSTADNKIGTLSKPQDAGLLSPSYYEGHLIYPLAANSQALDYGDVANSVGKGTTLLTNDIRGTGYNRVSGVRVDAGATERQKDVPIPTITTIPANSYSLRLGQTLDLTGSLTGTGSFTYLWDLSNNGIYGKTPDARGGKVTFDSTGIERTPGLPHKVRLIVVDNLGRRSEPVEYEINIISGWPTYELTGPRSFAVNEIQEWRIFAANAEEDPIVSWTISWGDGTPNTVLNGGPRNSVKLFHTYRTTGVFSVQVTTESYYGDKRSFSLVTLQVFATSGTQSFSQSFSNSLSANEDKDRAIPVQKMTQAPVAADLHDLLFESPLFDSFLTPTSVATEIAILAFYEQTNKREPEFDWIISPEEESLGNLSVRWDF